MAMMLSAMYQERLLDEYRAPQNRRELPDATGRAERKNLVCGDAVTVMWREDDGRAADVSFLGHGCSVAVASASLLTQVTVGLSVDQIRAMITDVELMLTGAIVELPAALEPLRGVVAFPARHGCVMMPWLALRDALPR